MQILEGKKFILPLTDSALVNSLQRNLVDHQATIDLISARDLLEKGSEDITADVVILDFVSENEYSTSLLKNLQKDDKTRTLIVLALLPSLGETNEAKALAMGAADFILETETEEGALLKIKTILGQPDKYSGSGLIDISPTEVHTVRNNLVVYVVEDDSLLRNLLTTKLEQSNFKFFFSTDGKSVKEEVEKIQPSIIVLDIMLPGISGLEILKELKEDKGTEEIPVIIFSNRDEQEDRQMAAELGAAGFYVKAMTDLSELMGFIEKSAR